jgi:hypothetical protein
MDEETEVKSESEQYMKLIEKELGSLGLKVKN